MFQPWQHQFQKSAESKISEGTDTISCNFNQLQKTLSEASALVHENSEHWMKSVHDGLLIDKEELTKTATDYEAIMRSFQNLFELLTFIRQQVHFLVTWTNFSA